jgi:protein-tyrosine kinase
MSRIYKALEKAEQERTLKKEVPFIITEHKSAKPQLVDHVQPTPYSPQAGFASDLVAIAEPNSLASEQFRKLRSQLLHLKITGPMTAIMVTSATQGEGKTFVASNLAIGIAQDLDLHALLVDCDLRKPSVAGHFGFEAGSGVSDYLIDARQRDISEFIVKTGIEKLSFLPAGTLVENPSELIGSNRMKELVQELKNRYSDRYIIFDSAPILATSESEVLAKLVDGVILVVRAGVTSRDEILQALNPLGKEKLLGVVLNQLEFKLPSLFSRYFGADGYYYRYGYGNTKNLKEPTFWQKLNPWGKKTSAGIGG